MILEMKAISKSFFGVKALSGVDFQLKKGEVHALVGENGAGKSTLMKILSGEQQPDEGKIFLHGKPVEISSPIVSQRLGISIIHQELNLIPHMTVAENIFLGRERRKLGMLADFNYLVRETKKLLERFQLDLDPKAKIYQLSIGQQQIVEIAKALSMNAEILIMDEPTAVLEERESARLFELIRQFKKQGVSIIYISHRLHELKLFCDRMTVLRDGEHVSTRAVEGITEQQIANLMVGRELSDFYPPKREVFGEIMLQVENATRKPYFENVSFHVRKGEIVGFAGLIGAGRTELFRTIFGDWKLESGKVIWKGGETNFRNPKDAIRSGFGFATEDRKQLGLFMEMNIAQNITAACSTKISRLQFIRRKQEERIVKRKMEDLNVKALQSNSTVKHLSGGNQQKVVIAKWLASDSELFILDEPTRGIDVGAKSEIYRIISQFAADGKAVVVISSDLPELLGLCNRIIVMHHGQIKGELDHRDVSEQKIMQLATGV